MSDGQITQLDDGSPFGSAEKPLITSDGLYWLDNSQYMSGAVRRTQDGLTVASTTEEFTSNGGLNFLTTVNDQVVFAGQTLDGNALRAVDNGLAVITLSPLQVGPTLDSLAFILPTFVAGDRKYFFASSDGGEPDLWRTDGTPAGTVFISTDLPASRIPHFAATTDNVFIATTDLFNQLVIYRVNDPAGDNNAPRSIELVTTLPYGFVETFTALGIVCCCRSLRIQCGSTGVSIVRV